MFAVFLVIACHVYEQRVGKEAQSGRAIASPTDLQRTDLGTHLRIYTLTNVHRTTPVRWMYIDFVRMYIGTLMIYKVSNHGQNPSKIGNLFWGLGVNCGKITF